MGEKKKKQNFLFKEIYSIEEMIKFCAIWSLQLIILLSEDRLELSKVYLREKYSLSLNLFKCECEEGYLWMGLEAIILPKVQECIFKLD